MHHVEYKFTNPCTTWKINLPTHAPLGKSVEQIAEGIVKTIREKVFCMKYYHYDGDILMSLTGMLGT